MAIDLTGLLELNISETVLSLEGNDGRFENFCRETVSRIEGGALIFSTSTSWDLGRDGVGAGAARGTYVCASLRDDVDNKALTDLQRLTATTSNIRQVYFCSSHRLTEHRITLLQSQLESEVDGAFRVICLGSRQLLEACGNDSALLERYYGAEIRDALRAISANPSDETEIRGLRLALIAAAGDSSSEIRRQLYSGGILDVLSDGAARTLTGCTKSLSERLRLGRIISDAAVMPHLEGLLKAGFVRKDGVVWKISTEGLQRHQELQIEAAERFITGRQSVRKSMEESLGENISDDDFNRIWTVFEDRVANNFHARGTALVAEVSALLRITEGSPTAAISGNSQLSFLEELATSVSSTSNHPQRRDELHQAVKNLFIDRTSGATEWLVKVCASYLACCALGLEHTSGEALTRLFARTSLVLDTDVVLSLLGEGEPEHSSVTTIVTKWANFGGKILVAEPVLEEVAYHAHIAKTDFQHVRHLMPGTANDRLNIIENAFVRSFAEIMSRGEATIEHWRRFIHQFSGKKPHDWDPVLSHLTSEYSISKLPSSSSDFDGLAAGVRKYLLDMAARKGFSGKVVSDKATRDSRLYAGIVQYQKNSKATDPGATSLLVSSARRLLNVERQFHESGEQQIVVPISTILHLLSLLPQVSLGLNAMKTFLFEERRPGFSSDLERSILRMVKSSHQVSLPWAKRGLLIKEVRNRLIDDAQKQGRNENIEALESEALLEGNQSRTLQLLGESLDRIAVSTTLEDENRRLRKENDQLRARLDTDRSAKAKKKS